MEGATGHLPLLRAVLHTSLCADGGDAAPVDENNLHAAISVAPAEAGAPGADEKKTPAVASGAGTAGVNTLRGVNRLPLSLARLEAYRSLAAPGARVMLKGAMVRVGTEEGGGDGAAVAGASAGDVDGASCSCNPPLCRPLRRLSPLPS